MVVNSTSDSLPLHNSQHNKWVKANPSQTQFFQAASQIMIPWPPSVIGFKVNRWAFNNEKQKRQIHPGF